MSQTFVVKIDGEFSEKEAEKMRQALQKSLGKWFKKGHAISVNDA